MSNTIKLLNQIKNVFNSQHKEQFLHENGCILYAISERDLNISRDQSDAIDKAIKIMKLMPDMIDDMEYLLDMAEEESGLDVITLSNNQDIRSRLNKAKEVLG